MSNIRQKTNFDLTGEATYPTIHYHGTETRDDIPYKTLVFDDNQGTTPIYKFGYCVNDNQGINYPILICFSENDAGKEFQIGKTGMFEIQQEELPNASETEDSEIKVGIYKLLISTLVPFVVDYYI